MLGLLLQFIRFGHGFLLLLFWGVKTLVLNTLRGHHEVDQHPPNKDDAEDAEQDVSDAEKRWILRQKSNDPEDIAITAVVQWGVTIDEVIRRLEWIGPNVSDIFSLHDIGTTRGTKSVSSAVALWWAQLSRDLCRAYDGSPTLLALELYGDIPYKNICSAIDGCVGHIEEKHQILEDIHLSPAAMDHLKKAIEASVYDLGTVKSDKERLIKMKGVVDGRLSKEQASSSMTDEPKQTVNEEIHADTTKYASVPQPQPQPPPSPTPISKPIKVEGKAELQSLQQTWSRAQGADNDEDGASEKEICKQKMKPQTSQQIRISEQGERVGEMFDFEEEAVKQRKTVPIFHFGEDGNKKGSGESEKAEGPRLATRKYATPASSRSRIQISSLKMTSTNMAKKPTSRRPSQQVAKSGTDETVEIMDAESILMKALREDFNVGLGRRLQTGINHLFSLSNPPIYSATDMNVPDILQHLAETSPTILEFLQTEFRVTNKTDLIARLSTNSEARSMTGSYTSIFPILYPFAYATNFIPSSELRKGKANEARSSDLEDRAEDTKSEASPRQITTAVTRADAASNNKPTEASTGDGTYEGLSDEVRQRLETATTSFFFYDPVFSSAADLEVSDVVQHLAQECPSLLKFVQTSFKATNDADLVAKLRGMSRTRPEVLCSVAYASEFVPNGKTKEAITSHLLSGKHKVDEVDSEAASSKLPVRMGPTEKSHKLETLHVDPPSKLRGGWLRFGNENNITEAAASQNEDRGCKSKGTFMWLPKARNGE